GASPAYLLAADVLVSPRSRGTHTPLKIYQYMRSGKPIVATRLLTHTQVLSDQTAILTGVAPREFADGILAGLNDRARAAAVGLAACELAETKYSYEAYLERTRQASAGLMPPATPVAAVKVRFLRGDAHALDFRDDEFDVVVCLRVLMHTPDWRRCLAELCRVAERLVIFDYPSATSAALLQSLARRAIQVAGGRTEAYRV